MKHSLGISNFLKEISSLFISSISLHCSLKKAFLKRKKKKGFLFSPCCSLVLCIQLNISFHFFFAFHFSANYEALSGNHFAFLNFFSFGIDLVTVCYTMLQFSIHNSSGTLSIRSSPLNLFVTSTV